jgi:transposase
MEVLYKQCAGLDVHKDTVVACVRITRSRRVTREVRSFATTTSGLLGLAAWLAEQRCTHVAMEATGVYWKPVWHVLEEQFALILANPAHVKNVPGRKTDVNDATWLAELLAHGLIRASFVPERATQELRWLMRTRKQLVREQVSHVQRVQKVLEDANIKLDSVLSDVLGASGRAMLEALIKGEGDPAVLAGLAHRRVKADRQRLIEALRGHVRPHHRFFLGLHLRQIDSLDQAIAAIDRQVEEQLAPFRAAIELLKSTPGVSDISARAIIAEIGTDMGRFADAGHLVSWAGMCARNDESAGKRRSTRLRKGDPWLKTVLVQCAWAATHAKHTYLQAQYYRLRARRGTKKALVAVAASILTAIYHMLRDGTFYHDLGPDYFQRGDSRKIAKRLLTRLHDLGYEVELKAAPA